MITVIADMGLLLDPTPDPAQAAAEARQWLQARGATEWDLLEINLPQQLRQVWWGGDTVGFVGSDHPDAQAAVIVNVPPRWLT